MLVIYLDNFATYFFLMIFYALNIMGYNLVKWFGK